MKFGTKAIHAGIEPDSSTGAIMTPIFQTSTYVQASPGVHKGFEYGRTKNPTRDVLQNSLAALENGKHGLAFSSGLAAIDAVLKLLSPGDEVIASNDMYGGTYRLFTQIYAKFGLKFHFIDMGDISNIENYINANTKLVWLETPTNPMMNIIDIQGATAITKKHNLLLAADNTFATPYLQRPLDFGVDIVMHSVTKYLGGHSDVVMGALIVNDDELGKKLAFIQNSSGATPGPQDCFLVLRGIKTLHLRVQRHCENAKVIAQYLKVHPKVEKVFWPGFADHPNHHIAQSQMKDYGGVVSFILKGDNKEESFELMGRLTLFSIAESLGGVESTVNHPATMSHSSVPYEDRQKIGLLDSLIRLSVGVEDADDLLDDLKQALG